MNRSSRHFNAAFRVVALAVLLCGMLFIQGCISPLKTKSDLSKLTQRHGLGHVYYIGTKEGFHYFATKYLLEPTKYYRLPESEYCFQRPFSKTSDKSKWVPFLINLNENTQGFRGEPKEPLQMTNPPAVLPKG